ncbi:hypothetical protein NECAME_05176 [Necator americanus]|uniref:Uncharacterized protein n=1 Tax=Necator americanus TaxID=51031 RepID=W2SJ25_NECAM|nr:hypothetical protein NECAME_05176 [Necator americanus]ETN69595.1 hypothetical protein NECAME_05176 [Necator americanus]
MTIDAVGGGGLVWVVVAEWKNIGSSNLSPSSYGAGRKTIQGTYGYCRGYCANCGSIGIVLFFFCHLKTKRFSARAASCRPTKEAASPPLICEQGPSAPSSPTSPRPRRPFPLTEDAMHRINLLSSGYDYGKLSPMSTYATSDLGSSPRSSISVASANLSPWINFRENHKNSFDLDDGGSDVCSKELLSPGMMLSPAPYSPFSDCEDLETPYSTYARSPNLSPNPLTRSFNHFRYCTFNVLERRGGEVLYGNVTVLIKYEAAVRCQAATTTSWYQKRIH